MLRSRVKINSIPSVDAVLRSAPTLVEEYGHELTVTAIRDVLEGFRKRTLSNDVSIDDADLIHMIEVRLRSFIELPFRSVINATGVVLHTNLGRAPLSTKTILAMKNIAENYNTLEFDLSTGKRGSRDGHLNQLLQTLTGAEAGFVVNNCASAVLLALSALAKGKQVIIPRSQLVEIGGGFRVPDVMKASGAKLLEVGTTNKVRLSDFKNAYAESKDPSKVISMRAHRSNFQIIGFTEEPELREIISVAHENNAIFIDDLGSGALIASEKFGMAHEPTVQESIASGADLVLFSGDKLVGGPQAGLLVGKSDVIRKLRSHPLARAVRADKTTIAGIHATLTHYLIGEAEREVPIWRSISRNSEEIRTRAERLRKSIGIGEVIEGRSTIGGGSLPGETLPTWLLARKVNRSNTFLEKLRQADPPLIARVEKDQVLIDLRTVEPDQDEQIAKILIQTKEQ